MCFNNTQASTSKLQKFSSAPVVPPLKIASTSKLDPVSFEPKKQDKKISYGSKSSKNIAKKPKKDAASLLIPLNETGSKPGGINA